MRRISKPVLLATLLYFAVGCDPEGLYEYQINVRDQVELLSGLALLEGDPGRVVFLEVAESSVRVRQPLTANEGERISWLTGGPNRDAPSQLFAMTVPVDERETGIDRAFLRVDPSTGTIDRFLTGSEFGGLAFAPGWRFALLYHLSSDGGESGALFNPNEIAVVDLNEPPSQDNPQILSVDIGGRTITGIDFVETLEVDGEIRSLAVFYAEGMVKLLDLLDLSIPAIAIMLTADDDPREVEPTQVIARAGDETRDPTLFVRARYSQDIYAISLVPRPDGLPGFWASLNQFDGGTEPSDLLLIDDGEVPLLMVANWYGSETNVINIDTADTFSLHLENTAQYSLLRGETGAREVVLYGGSTDRVHFVAVDGLIEEQDSNLDDLLIPDGVNQASVLDADRLLITPANSSDLLVLDLATRDIIRLTAPGGYDWQDAEIFGSLFFAANPGSDRVVSLDLTTGHPQSLVLDEPVSSFHTFDAAGMGLVVHRRCPDVSHNNRVHRGGSPDARRLHGRGRLEAGARPQRHPDRAAGHRVRGCLERRPRHHPRRR
ncbi:MAG: hypothetical protein JRF63_13010 [Deltaproteobacteria bacterium]|nr:hypothetical protein [Deltaproteobacteria bacterium]